jgi:hypothetical protein
MVRMKSLQRLAVAGSLVLGDRCTGRIHDADVGKGRDGQTGDDSLRLLDFFKADAEAHAW